MNNEGVGREARKWSKALLGLGISVPLALAPLLGRVNVAGFSSLLNLIPEDLQNFALAMGASAMSLVAASVEFRALSIAPRTTLLKQANRSLLYAAVFLAALGCAYVLLVTRVPFGGSHSHSFVTGFIQPNTPPCVGLAAENCIKYLTLDQAAVNSYFGDRQVRFATILLVLLYVLFFAFFGNLVGILIALKGRSVDHP
jgi:hypothetical protein